MLILYICIIFIIILLNYRKANASSSLCENPPPCLIRIWLSELKPAVKRALLFISLITMKLSSLLLLASKILSMSKLLLDTRYCNCYVALINLYILCENVLRVNRKNKCVREVMKLKMYYCIQIKLGISSRIVNHCQIHILGVKWVTSLYIWRFYLAYLMMWMASASFFHNDDSNYHGGHQCHSSK